MAREKQLSKEKRAAIITLRNEGQSVRKIGNTLKLSPSAVAKTIKRYKETGSYEDRPRNGRPRVTSAAEDKFIQVTSFRNRRLTAAQIRNQINATHSSSSRHISTTTVKRRLCAAGLHGKIATKKPLLRTGNKQKRLKPPGPDPRVFPAHDIGADTKPGTNIPGKYDNLALPQLPSVPVSPAHLSPTNDPSPYEDIDFEDLSKRMEDLKKKT